MSLDASVFLALSSKMTLRQMARVFGCRRETIELRLDRYGEHAHDFHRLVLDRQASMGGMPGDAFVLDELETFENSRRLQPLTVAVVVERKSYFVVDLAVGTLPARKPLNPALEQRRIELEALHGPRVSQSRSVVELVLGRLARSLPPRRAVKLFSDRKKTYPNCLRRTLGGRASHIRVSSRLRRTVVNPLFAINFSFAMMRDGISRLVRRSWAASKKADRLTRHLWIWVGWRNYVRWYTNRTSESRRSASAKVLAVRPRRMSVREFLRWKVFPNSWPWAPVG